MLLHLVRGLCQILRRHFVMPWIRHGTSQNCSRDSFPEVTAPCLRQRQAPAAQTCALEALEGCDLTALSGAASASGWLGHHSPVARAWVERAGPWDA